MTVYEFVWPPSEKKTILPIDIDIISMLWLFPVGQIQGPLKPFNKDIVVYSLQCNNTP